MAANTEDIYHGRQDRFVQESLKDPQTGEYKTIDHVPGITPACQDQLMNIGINEAAQLVGKLLVLGMDKEMYTQWFLDTVQVANVNICAQQSYNSLKEWIERNM